jgi:hypothetical protein
VRPAVVDLTGFVTGDNVWVMNVRDVQVAMPFRPDLIFTFLVRTVNVAL